MKHEKQKAFTLVELIVVASIIAILGTIGFVSFSESIPDARDAQRKSDMAKVLSSMKTYKQKKWSYPFPGDKFELTFWTNNVFAYQGFLNNNVSLSTLNEIPLDPELKIPYLYSTLRNRSEFQIAGTLENKEQNKAILKWDYKTVSKLLTPTIVIAAIADTNINTVASRELFIFDGGKHNLPYDFEWNTEPTTDGSTINQLVNDPSITFWVNNDFSSCTEIGESGKDFWDHEYQILNGSGDLVSTNCSF